MRKKKYTPKETNLIKLKIYLTKLSDGGKKDK